MTRYTIFTIIIYFAFIACSNQTADKNLIIHSDIKQDSSSSTHSDSTIITQTHLQDTTIIDGNFVLFLRPDSTRFDRYTKEGAEIYEADSDFGFGIAATMDSISNNIKYKNIRSAISVGRFIVIKDCKSCPLTIDRDTINYGLILTAQNNEIKINTFIHSGDYLYDIDEYFNIKNIKNDK